MFIQGLLDEELLGKVSIYTFTKEVLSTIKKPIDENFLDYIKDL